MDATAVTARVQELMPGLVEELGMLIGIPSIAFPGYPAEPVLAAANAVVELLQRSGLPDARLLEVPGGYPAVYGELPAPPGAPTVLLYAHYDVQPAPLEQGWTTDPFTAVTGPDGRIHGRGAADDKSGVIIHAGTLQALAGDCPVGIKVLIEGEEETVSHLEAFVGANPELVDCDAFVIADMGPQVVGRPALTTALRGDVSCTVRVRTLEHPVHSGLFGGAAPDALVALIKILASMHDDHGTTVVPGLQSGDWHGAEVDEDVFRQGAAVLPGVDLVGTGTIASRTTTKPSATVLGIDAPSIAASSNVLHAEAAAKVSLRIPPGAEPDVELGILMRHLESVAPCNVRVDVTPVAKGWPFAVDETAPAVAAARAGLEAVFGRPVEMLGCGGSIPLVNSLHEACPRAGIVLWGAEDAAQARIHGSDESVDPAEIGRIVAAQVLTLQALAGR